MNPHPLSRCRLAVPSAQLRQRVAVCERRTRRRHWLPWAAAASILFCILNEPQSESPRSLTIGSCTLERDMDFTSPDSLVNLRKSLYE